MCNTLPPKYENVQNNPTEIQTTKRTDNSKTEHCADRRLQQKIRQLFFDHLDEVVKADTITLEQTKSRKDSILAQTETYLRTLPVSPQTLSDLYQQFLATTR